MPATQMLTKLPKPDRNGNYWLSEGDGKVKGPAVFPSKKLVHREGEEGEVVRNGYFLASTGSAILWYSENWQLKRFNTPQAALDALIALDNGPS